MQVMLGEVGNRYCLRAGRHLMLHRRRPMPQRVSLWLVGVPHSEHRPDVFPVRS
jgi:hypothetical protein